MKGRIVKVEIICLCDFTQPPIVDCAPLRDHAIALSAWSASRRAVVTRKLTSLREQLVRERPGFVFRSHTPLRTMLNLLYMPDLHIIDAAQPQMDLRLLSYP